MQIVGLADESTVADRGKLDMKLRYQVPEAQTLRSTTAKPVGLVRV